MRVAIIVLFAGLLAAMPARAAAPGGFALHDVRLFDGWRVRPHANVIVRGGRIVAAGRGVRIPRGLDVIEGAGMTLLPGLIDAHVHVFAGAQADALRFGVTTELDMFSVTHDFPRWRAQRRSLAQTADADTWSAGIGVSAPDGEASRMLPPGFPLPTLSSAADAEAFVAARVAEGSDYIKLILESDSALSPGEHMPSLSRDALCAATAAAHAHSRLAVVHISKQEDAREAIRCGADGLAHLFGDRRPDPDFVRYAAARRVFFVTTLAVIGGVSGMTLGRDLAADPRVAPFLSAGQRRSLATGFPATHASSFGNAMAAALALHHAGIPLLAGTDAPGPQTAHGVALHLELRLLVRAGLTPLDALRATTARPARAFHLGDRGRIAPGYRADLLLVRGDPTRSIGDTLAIERIWKNGYPVDRRPPVPAASQAAR